MATVLPLTSLVSQRIGSTLPKHMKQHNGLPLYYVQKKPKRAIELDSTSIVLALRRITKK